MPLGIPPDLTLYQLLQEQGSLIAGVLALIAGRWAYRAGKDQATVVQKQTDLLKQNERRSVARSSFSAVILLLAALQKTKADIEELHEEADRLRLANATIKEGFANKIYKPDIAIAWQSLGATSAVTAKEYIAFDAEIDAYKRQQASNPTFHKNELWKLKGIADLLIEDLDGQAKKLQNIFVPTVAANAPNSAREADT